MRKRCCQTRLQTRPFKGAALLGTATAIAGGWILNESVGAAAVLLGFSVFCYRNIDGAEKSKAPEKLNVQKTPAPRP